MLLVLLTRYLSVYVARTVWSVSGDLHAPWSELLNVVRSTAQAYRRTKPARKSCSVFAPADRAAAAACQGLYVVHAASCNCTAAL